MDDAQKHADTSEDSAIRRLLGLRLTRPDPWVRGFVVAALLGYFGFFLIASSDPGCHCNHSCFSQAQAGRLHC